MSVTFQLIAGPDKPFGTCRCDRLPSDRMPDFHVYEPLNAPDVEVEVDGQWWPAEATMRTDRNDGRLTYHVPFASRGSDHLDKFPLPRLQRPRRQQASGG